MNIGILDDSEQDRGELVALLRHYFLNIHVEVEITEFSTVSSFIDHYKSGLFQIVFLDIYLNDGCGMDAARILYQEDPNCRLVFFTTSFDHAVDSYQVHAAYYLTKPVQYSRLSDALHICCADLISDSISITVQVGHTQVPICLSDILYIDCLNRTVRIHLENKSVAIKDSLIQIVEEISSDKRFLYCNRNIYVNMDWIMSVSDNDFIMKNYERVPIRVRGRGTVKKQYLEYSLQGLKRRTTI